MNDVPTNEMQKESLEVLGENPQMQLSPEEEYRKGRKKSQRAALLLALLMTGDVLACAVLWGGIASQDFGWRVRHQIENIVFGKVYLETGEYVGETDFGYFAGEGTFSYYSGSFYSGQWADNDMMGVGTLNDTDKGTYEGGFSQSKKEGEGTFTWGDGDQYVGEWKNDRMSGQGKYVSADGVEYSGTFQDNAFWQGTCKFENTTGSYEATFKDGIIDNLVVSFSDGSSYQGSCDATCIAGKGRMELACGDSFDGEFQDGVRNGSGVYVWANGDKYEGSWSDDAMNGSGVYTYANGNIAQGQFADNQFVEGSYEVNNDFGKYTFAIKEKKAVSVSMALLDGTVYAGDIADGKLTGSAQIVYGNGDKYSGHVDDGRKSGSGTYSWSNGASYEGDWSNDRMNGNGTYRYPTGKAGYKITGSFSDGQPDGECQYYTDSSKSYKTDWRNGVCVKVYE